MGCDDVKRVLGFFLDGALSEKKYRAVLDHFGLCRDCEQRKVVQQRLRRFVVARVQRVVPSERFLVRLSRSLRGMRAGL